MILEPLYKTGEKVWYRFPKLNDIVEEDAIVLIIVQSDQWLVDDKCWLYRAISTRTNHLVYVKEKDLSIVE
jgi:hypothetical protein